MSRQNFAEEVNKDVLGQQQNRFFNVVQLYPDFRSQSQTYTTKMKQANDHLNLDGKIKTIILNVHEQLRVRQLSSPIAAKAKPKSTTEKLTKKFKPKNPCSTVEKKNIRLGGKGTDDVICESIPQIKVLCINKHKECVHKETENAYNCVSFESHKRMLLAQQRKSELENMIKEHKFLIEDRRSLEQDVFAMRHYLDDLHHRVNSSLQQLHNKKTFCEHHGLLVNKNSKNVKKPLESC